MADNTRVVTPTCSRAFCSAISGADYQRELNAEACDFFYFEGDFGERVEIETRALGGGERLAG